MIYFFLYFIYYFCIFADNNTEDTFYSLAYKDYDKMYNGGYLSEEEKKIIGTKEESVYNLNHIFVTDLETIKNDNKNIFNKYFLKYKILDVTYLDKYSLKQQYLYKMQDLGVEGSPAKLYIPSVNNSVTSSTGYCAFDIYNKIFHNDLIFDTRAHIIDFKTTYNKHSHSLDCNIKLAMSINKNLHIGFSLYPMFKERLFGTMIQKNMKKQHVQTDMNIINIPFSTYYLYKSNNEKHLLYINLYMKRNTLFNNGGLEGCYEKIYYNPDNEILNNINKLDKINTEENIYKALIYYQCKFKKFTLYIENNFELQRHILNFNIKKELIKQDDNTTKVGYLISHPTEKTVKYCTNRKIEINNNNVNYVNDIFPFSTYDSYIKNCFEIGFKKNIKNLFFRTYIKLNLPVIRCVSHDDYSTNDENIKHLYAATASITKCEYVNFEPVCGIYMRFYNINITFETLLLQYDFKNPDTRFKKIFFIDKEKHSLILPIFNFDVNYKNNFINVEFNISKSQLPDIYKSYGTLINNKIRSYKNENSEDPLNIFLKVNGDIYIKKRITLKPYFISTLKSNNSFFQQIEINSKNCCSTPTQFLHNILHMYGGLFTKIHIAGPVFFDVDISINKKFMTKKETKDIPLKIFTLSYKPDCNISNILTNAPSFNFYCRLYLSKDFNNNVANLTIGFDGFWNNSFISDNYDIITQQFFYTLTYIRQPISQYPIINFFVNFRFGNFEFSAKITNILQTFNIFGLGRYNFSSTMSYPTEMGNYMFTIRYIFID